GRGAAAAAAPHRPAGPAVEHGAERPGELGGGRTTPSWARRAPEEDGQGARSGHEHGGEVGGGQGGEHGTGQGGGHGGEHGTARRPYGPAGGDQGEPALLREAEER
ncbi:hypothetical protein ACFU9E_34270, partial [Kitasatospora sp. NPDC057595]